MSIASPVPYELYALRYATRSGRRAELFLDGDPHDAPLAIDYYVWLARRDGHVCLIDTGFNERLARERHRALLRDPIDSLELLGTKPAQVQDLVLTHFHYDHAGNFDRLPNARLHVQDLEMQYVTGRYMAHAVCKDAYQPDVIASLVRQVFQGRVQFHAGDSTLTDGITLHHVGGHTMGQQFVRVFTRRGWVVIASDAAHFYEGYLSCRPIRLVFHVGDTIRGFERLRDLADSDDHVVPGHDAAVMRRYAAPSARLEGIAVRLDDPPRMPYEAIQSRESK